MKKSILLIFAALATLAVSAQNGVEIDGIWYNLDYDTKQAEVTFKGSSYNEYDDEYSGAITIPATVIYEGVNYSVTSIGDQAFSSCSILTTINIPGSVTSIGEAAFSNCSSLTAITIPEGVTSIEYYAFFNCISLTAIILPEEVTSIGGNAFYNCTSLTTINIPKSVTSIGKFAFSNCSSITSITIPAGSQLTSIGNSAFYYCKSLKSIILPEGVTSIGDQAFRFCISLTTINIPEGVTSIGGSVCSGCISLTAITIHEGVTSIGEYAFSACRSLTTITCEAETPPSIVPNTFSDFDKSIPVYVLKGSVNAYQSAEYWREFTNIQPLNKPVTDITLNHSSVILTEGEIITLTATISPKGASDTSVTWSSSDEDVAMVSSKGKVITLSAGTAIITATANDGSGVSASCEVTVKKPILGKCATPTISYVDGEVVLVCDTEGVIIKYEITENASGKFEDTRICLIPTYTITAYATKEQYEDSDIATLTLCWIPCTEEHENEEDGILNIPAKPVLISTQGGVITVSGLAAGTAVAAYSTAGTQLATATATNGTATLTTNLEAGSIAIVKMGDYSIKVAIK